MDCRTFIYPSFRLASGAVLAEAKLVYAIGGRLNAARDNAIVYPTSFGTRHGDIAWLVGPGRPFDTNRYCVIVPNMLGNGLSSSPSHVDAFAPGTFPRLSVADSVDLQYAFVHDELRIDHVALVAGFSMGGQQAYHWAARYPDALARAAMICASARTSVHNRVFIDSLKVALMQDPSWNGRYFNGGAATKGVAAMARIYASWGTSAEFYRRRLYRQAIAMSKTSS